MTALLFPGQGSQQAGMHELVAARRPDLLELATQSVGANPFEHLQDGTAYLQPAIYCASMACLLDLDGVTASAYAGHSLGELSALVAARSLDSHDGLLLVVERGRLMQRAAAARPDGAMLAVQMSAEAGGELARSFGLTLANDNSPDQVVLSGEGEAIARARAEAKSRGYRASRLPIKGAFHSPCMESIVDEFRETVAQVPFRPPRRPVFSCVTGAELRDEDDMRARVVDSLTHGVRWRQVLFALQARGIHRFIDVGPGAVLAKLVAKTLPGVEVDALQALEAA